MTEEFKDWNIVAKRTLRKIPHNDNLTFQQDVEKGILPYFKFAIRLGASDVHIKKDLPVVFRHHGELKIASDELMDAEKLRYMAYQILPKDRIEQYEAEGELDFTYSLPTGHRFRLSVYKDNGIDTIAARLIAVTIPNIDELGLPEVILEFTKLRQGLVLVTGPTGSGKSSTLAAMIDHINNTTQRHIITLEDPIEYLHEHKKSIISQREVGRDTQSFSSGLKAALRQDPDILLVGELRDLETIQIAITAAETGHLVFATLHTSSAPSTIDRVIDVFPTTQQMQIRTQLATSLEGVISQRLFKNPKGEGRVVACEILMMDSSIANLIRTEKVHQIPTFMQTGKAKGMQLMEEELRRLGITQE